MFAFLKNLYNKSQFVEHVPIKLCKNIQKKVTLFNFIIIVVKYLIAVLYRSSSSTGG